MKLIPAKTPEFVKSLFPNFVWNYYGDTKTLYLTFDDGPTPEITDWVLDTLGTYEAKASFFCLGKNINKHPEIFRQIIDQGHCIGNHTYNHLKGWKYKTNDYIEDVIRTEEIFESNNERTISRTWHNKLFRPPYGKFKVKQSKQLVQLGFKIIMWDVLSFDWDKNTSREQCLNNIISTAKAGSIIVFHDSVKASRNLQYVLPKVLEYYSRRGYSFKAIKTN